MENELRNWTRVKLDDIWDRDLKTLDALSLALIVMGLGLGYFGSLLAESPLPLLVGSAVSLPVALALMMGRRRARAKNPAAIKVQEDGFVIRRTAGDEWVLPFSRIHKVAESSPEVGRVYYFDEKGWLRKFVVDQGLSRRLEGAFTEAVKEKGPFAKPPVAFRPIVSLPWILGGASVVSLGLSTLLLLPLRADSPIYIWALLGLEGGLAMLVYGILTVMWWYRENERRRRGEATAMLVARIG